MANLIDSQLTDYTALHPCVTCLPGNKLDQLIVVLLAMKAGFTMPDDLNTMVDTTACLKCLSETQLKENLAAFLWEQVAPNSTVEELTADGKCLQCVDPKTLQVLYGYLLVLGLTPVVN